jgi:HSP20 family protein
MATTLARRAPRQRNGLPSIFSTEPFGTLREEFDQLLSNWFSSADTSIAFPTFAPLLDMNETDGAYEVKLDLPGVKANEINVQVSENVLTISGERKCEKASEKDKAGTPHHIERYHGTFSRSIVLPSAVNQEKIDAQYHDGVLTVTLPKTEGAKPCHVTVKS